MKLAEFNIPEPKSDQVLIKVDSIGLNPVDYKLIEGPLASFDYPHIFGLDAAGTVVAVGDAITDFKVGDRVSGHNDLHQDGTFAEYAIYPEYCLTKIPDAVSFETATALLCGAMTAYQAIHRKMNLIGKKTILIHAGAGGVGSIAVQLAKLAGLKVITTVSTNKVDFVKTLHPDKIVDYKQADVTKEVLAFTDGAGVDLALNTVSGYEAKLDVEQRLSYNGQLVWIAAAPKLADETILPNRGLTISSLNLGGAHNGSSQTQKEDLSIMAGALLELVQTHQLEPNISKVLPFDQLVTGLDQLVKHDSVGKIIVQVSK